LVNLHRTALSSKLFVLSTYILVCISFWFFIQQKNHQKPDLVIILIVLSSGQDSLTFISIYLEEWHHNHNLNQINVLVWQLLFSISFSPICFHIYIHLTALKYVTFTTHDCFSGRTTNDGSSSHGNQVSIIHEQLETDRLIISHHEKRL